MQISGRHGGSAMKIASLKVYLEAMHFGPTFTEHEYALPQSRERGDCCAIEEAMENHPTVSDFKLETWGS
jgi:hypothetical protein